MPSVRYRDIAWWAETADGARDQDLVLAEIEEDGQVAYVVEPASKAEKDKHKVILKGIRIDSVCPDRPKVDNVLIDVKGVRRECRVGDEICDSVFCSESAVEKFLFPYYRTQRLFTDEEWADLLAIFHNNEVPAIGHVAPSRPGPVGVDEVIRVLRVEVSKTGAVANADWLRFGEYRNRFIRAGKAR